MGKGFHEGKSVRVIENQHGYLELISAAVKTRDQETQVPIPKHEIAALQVGDMVYVSGNIFCRRDAVLPRICKLIRERRLEGEFEGAVVFHSAVSPLALVTSSNKVEIGESMASCQQRASDCILGRRYSN